MNTLDYTNNLLVKEHSTHKLLVRLFWGMNIAWLSLILLLEWNELLPYLDMMDKKLLLVLNYIGTERADFFWYHYSQLQTWYPMIIMILVACIKYNHGSLKKKMLYILVLVLLLVVLDQLSSGVIKPLVGRLRPSHDPSISNLLHYVNNYRGGTYGFLSGHATNVTGLTTWLCLTFRHRFTRIVLILFAVLMCYSRIYLGVHYPGDVIAGAILGFSLSWFTF